MFATEQQRDAALDAVQEEMLRIATSMDERYEVDSARHQDVPTGYVAPTHTIEEHELPDDGDTGVHRRALMLQPAEPGSADGAKEAPSEPPAGTMMDVMERVKEVVGTSDARPIDITKVQGIMDQAAQLDGEALDEAAAGKKSTVVGQDAEAATRREKNVKHLVKMG